ncbi:hypothetical protein D3C76_648410 [compost metagenome]
MVGALHVLPPPGVAERPDGAQHVAAAEAPAHHQQVQRQRQQAVGDRLQQAHHQRQQHQRRQYREQHAQPRPLRHRRHAFHGAQQAEPETVALQPAAPAGELLDQQRQQQHQKTHFDSL